MPRDVRRGARGAPGVPPLVAPTAFRLAQVSVADAGDPPQGTACATNHELAAHVASALSFDSCYAWRSAGTHDSETSHPYLFLDGVTSSLHNSGVCRPSSSEFGSVRFA